MRTANRLPGMPGLALVVIYIVLAALPLALAYSQNHELRPWRDELSSAMAMVAYAMLLMEFVISGRFRIISGRIGIDVSMRFHRWAAYLLTALLLLHPWLYSLSTTTSPLDASAVATLGLTGAATATGWLAWFGLIVLTAWAAFRDSFGYRYETWRVCHGFAALAVTLLGLHHALAAGRYSAALSLAALWWIFVAIALLSLIYVYLLGPMMQRNRPYRVTSVENIGLKIWELTIEPQHGDALAFEAGQFVWLTLNRSAFAITEHPFSISSCPADRPKVSFTIKEVGDFTSTIGAIPVGASAYLDGPHGNVVLAGREGKGIALIAGGVGVAPILSILRQARSHGETQPIRLIYGNRVIEQILYRDELDAMRSDLNLEVIHVLSEPPAQWSGKVGQLDRDVLDACLPTVDRSQWLYLVCGPGPMISSVEQCLSEFGIPSRQIVSEKFS